MHDLAAIRSQHIQADARTHAMPLLFALEKFVAGDGDVDKAKQLIDLVYARQRAASEQPVNTGPTRYIPLTNRPADGLTVARDAA